MPTKAWRLANPEKAREQSRRGAANYRRRYPEKAKAASVLYDRQHPAKRRARERRKRTQVSRRYNTARQQAKWRSLLWSLSLDEFDALTAGWCVYCDGSLPKIGCGLDRIDNSNGYEIGNVLPCCGRCNAIRGRHLGVEDMMVAMRAIAEHRGG